MTKEQHPQQLSLLPAGDVPLRFRLDAATVARGRRHIAEIRQMLRHGEPDDRVDQQHALPPRRTAA
jgi:hypothetical protein